MDSNITEFMMSIFNIFKKSKKDVAVSSSVSEDYLDRSSTVEKQEKKKKQSNIGSTFLVKGKSFAFYFCSIISALVNLIFISNLTKSPYRIGGIFSIPAAVFLGALSIALDISKALHVVQVNTLRELYRKLEGNDWAINIKRVANKWFAIYILYVALSVFTSVSLSSISIGEGITSNRNTINLINNDIAILQKYSNTDEASESIEFNSLLKSVNNSDKAIDIAEQRSAEAWQLIQVYRKERADFPFDKNSMEEVEYNGKIIVPNSYWDERNSKIRSDLAAVGVTLTDTQIRSSATMESIAQVVKQNRENLTTNSSMEELQALSAKTKQRYVQAILNLEGKYRYPDYYDDDGKLVKGDIVEFDENNLSGTISKLTMLRVKYENDSGDIGSSSKIFMQVGSTIDSLKTKTSTLDDIAESEVKTSSSIGTTELLMMLMLLFLSLLCELAINQFAPKVRISRKMLYQFSQYYPKNFNVNKFMDEVDKELRDYDMIDLTRKEEIENAKNSIKKNQQLTLKELKELETLKTQVEVLQRENNSLKEAKAEPIRTRVIEAEKPADSPAEKSEPKEDSSSDKALLEALMALKQSVSGE